MFRAIKTFIVAFCLAIIWLILTPGCTPMAWESTDYKLHMEKNAQDGWLSANDSDVMMSNFLKKLLPSTGWSEEKVRSCLSQEWIESEATSYTCEARNALGNLIVTTCDGTEDWTTVHVVENACPWDSALRHETSHWLQRCIENFDDVNHTQEDVWEIVNTSRPPSQDCLGN